MGGGDVSNTALQHTHIVAGCKATCWKKLSTQWRHHQHTLSRVLRRSAVQHSIISDSPQKNG